MKISHLLHSSAALCSLFCIAATAQTRFCTGGDLDHLTSAQKASCTATLRTVRSVASTLHAPDDWHFVIVCGEDGWQSYAAFATRTEGDLQSAIADTHLDTRETFLRGSRLQDHGDTSVRNVVAHEIAGILLKTKDTVAVQQKAGSPFSQSRMKNGL